MTELKQIYRCNKCGNIVEVLHIGGGTLVCCGEPMELLKENSVDAVKEKHVPVVESTADGVKVTVGSVEHPMTEEHYIEWIEVISGEQVYRKKLKPGQKPIVAFKVSGTVFARAYCNLHGLWKS